MSGLQNFLTPYSHLIFANRNVVIVVLAGVLGIIVVQLLMARWRVERLERDLTAARSSQSTSPARSRHMPPQLADESQSESGGLPPIKGGRSYARNLGSALQKAGIPAPGPQLYSPPVPPGWSANTGNGQPNPMQAPMQPPTYAPPPAPWGQPPAQPAAPWGYPAAANRAPFGAPPAAPTPTPYVPQQPAASGPGQPYQPPYQQASPNPFPAPFAPPGSPGDQGRQNLEPGQPYGAPPLPPQGPVAVSGPTGYPPQAPEPPAEEPAPNEKGRRGKPKRRRFNLSVLDSLEKMVQPKTVEANPSASQAAAPEAPIPPPAVSPVPTLASPVVAPTLFDQAAVEEKAQPQTEAIESEQESEPAASADGQTSLIDAPPSQPEAEAPAPVQERRSNRPDMRSMLFGEEPVAESQVVESSDPTPEEVPAEVEENVVAQSDEQNTGWAHPEPAVAEEPVEAVAAEADAQVSDVQMDSLSEAPAVEAAVEPAAEPTAPQAEEAVSSETADEVPAAINGEGNPTSGEAGALVIIEDDQAAADYYATLFRGNGYKVDVANDGVSGVDLCVRVQPQVILLDVMMPRQNGILVLQTLRASDETRNTPVVVMSNFSEPTLIKRALQLGALEYVIKTQVEGAALLTALPHWINREKAFAA